MEDLRWIWFIKAFYVGVQKRSENGIGKWISNGLRVVAFYRHMQVWAAISIVCWVHIERWLCGDVYTYDYILSSLGSLLDIRSICGRSIAGKFIICFCSDFQTAFIAVPLLPIPDSQALWPSPYQRNSEYSPFLSSRNPCAIPHLRRQYGITPPHLSSLQILD